MKSQFSPRAFAAGFAVAFAVAGLAGFAPNPIVGADGVFVTNTAHNFVHLVTGALFGLFALRGDAAALTFTRAFGPAYLLVGVIGLGVLAGSSEGMLLGFIHINQFDNYLHLGLGTIISAVGFLQRPAVAVV